MQKLILYCIVGGYQSESSYLDQTRQEGHERELSPVNQSNKGDISRIVGELGLFQFVNITFCFYACLGIAVSTLLCALYYFCIPTRRRE